MRWLDYVSYGLALVAMVYGLQQQDAPRTRSELREAFEQPPVTVGTPEPHKARGVTAGTGFATRNAGRWMTAYHVVDHCSAITLRVKHKGLFDTYASVRADLYMEADNADLAMVASPYKPREYLALADPASQPQQGQKGFAIGFPGAAPGEVYTQLLGVSRGTMYRGQTTFHQPLLVWSIIRTSPGYTTLQGISGGPILNEHGKVVGVNTAGSDRRGRLMTSTTEPLVQMLAVNERMTTTAVYKPASLLTEENFHGEAGALRDRYTISQIVCSHS